MGQSDVTISLDSEREAMLREMEKDMMERAVRFQYRKKDGTPRDAEGTLRRSLMVQDDGTLWMPKGEPRKPNPSVVSYFDLQRKSWRSFVKSNFIGYAKA